LPALQHNRSARAHHQAMMCAALEYLQDDGANFLGEPIHS
jgi:hypothetical protein